MNNVRRKREAEPEPGSGLVLSLDQIAPFENDPRQSPNAEYARIKASVQAQGVDQPLVVTRRPGTDQYLIAAGGNTRLKVVRELFEETGDPRFAQVACVFKPWQGEAATVLAHLRENDLRGGLTFLDKACAVRTIRQLLLRERGSVEVTQVEFVQFLKDGGYALSQTSLSFMGYVTDVLALHLPAALRAGLGRKEVERIRALERAASALWTDRVPSDAESFGDIFATLCRRYDGPDWDLMSLRQALEAEIAERLNQTVHAIRLALDARLSGLIEPALPCREGEDEWWPEAIETRPRSLSERREEANTHPPASGPAETITKADTPTESSHTPLRPVQDSYGPTSRHVANDLAPASGNEVATDPTSDLARLRVEAAGLATALATRHSLGGLVVPLADRGAGFLITDVPDPALLDQLDEAALAQLSMVWWQLMACAEMTVAPVTALLPHLTPTCTLYRALRDQDAGLLFNAVWTLDPGQVGFRLWRTLSEQDWSDLLSLMACYRNLHRVAAAANVALWSTAT